MSGTGEHCRDGSESQRIFRISDSCFYPAHLSHTVFFQKQKAGKSVPIRLPGFLSGENPAPHRKHLHYASRKRLIQIFLRILFPPQTAGPAADKAAAILRTVFTMIVSSFCNSRYLLVFFMAKECSLDVFPLPVAFTIPGKCFDSV